MSPFPHQQGDDQCKDGDEGGAEADALDAVALHDPAAGRRAGGDADIAEEMLSDEAKRALRGGEHDAYLAQEEGGGVRGAP